MCQLCNHGLHKHASLHTSLHSVYSSSHLHSQMKLWIKESNLDILIWSWHQCHLVSALGAEFLIVDVRSGRRSLTLVLRLAYFLNGLEVTHNAKPLMWQIPTIWTGFYCARSLPREQHGMGGWRPSKTILEHKIQRRCKCKHMIVVLHPYFKFQELIQLKYHSIMWGWSKTSSN
jgi:hypothetical protein